MTDELQMLEEFLAKNQLDLNKTVTEIGRVYNESFAGDVDPEV